MEKVLPTLHHRPLEGSLTAQVEAKMGSDIDTEVIPRRDLSSFIDRRNTHFLADMRLMLRRLAHYMSVTAEHRFEWQRNMTRTRMMDEALKEIFTRWYRYSRWVKVWWQRFPLNLAGGCCGSGNSTGNQT